MANEATARLEKTIAADYGNIAGMVVRKNDETVYTGYFNGCDDSSRIHVYSVAKSIVSILVGVAIDKGLIQGVDQPVLDFFPDYSPKKRQGDIRNITLKHLLTMTAPFRFKLAPLTFMRYFMSDDWVRFTLDSLGGKNTAGQFRYMPIVGPDILSGILMRATGQSVLGFAAENLFAPLGIVVERSVVFETAKDQSAFNKATGISGWAADKAGTNPAGWGLTLSPVDMAKIGQLYLNGGVWNDRQIVSAGWIHESTREHSRWDEMDLPYGYLWWIIDPAGHACAAMGDGGNVIYFNAQKNLVVSIASLFMQNAKDRLAFIQEHVEPLFQ